MKFKKFSQIAIFEFFDFYFSDFLFWKRKKEKERYGSGL